jgi:inosine/xanthosine triphosphate pyrophosphatase family protein
MSVFPTLATPEIVGVGVRVWLISGVAANLVERTEVSVAEVVVKTFTKYCVPFSSPVIVQEVVLVVQDLTGVPPVLSKYASAL